MGFKSIAIDGPSGAGKSTLAQMAAKELGYLYVDTGAIYRTLGLAALRHGVDPESTPAVVALLEDLQIDLKHGEDGLQHMYLEGEDVNGAIREPEVAYYASRVSAIAEVRAFLMDMQRNLALHHNVIMDGRDIGTVVLPDADVKVFLTASAEDRARRRYDQLVEKGTRTTYREVLRDIVARDERDMNRAAAPLRQAEDASLVDTSGKDLNESFDLLMSVLRTGVAE